MSSSPLRLSIRGFNIGIPAATAASKYKQELLSIARETNSSPQSATISLLAVITDFPLLNKAFIYCLPGSIPQVLRLLNLWNHHLRFHQNYQ